MGALNSQSEATAALIWAAFFLAFSLQTVISDVKYRRVSNHMILFVLTLQTVWLIGSFFKQNPPSIWSESSAFYLIGSGLFYLAILFPFWLKKVVGGGDVKYIATLAYLVGAEQTLYLILMGSIAMGLYAVVLLTFKKIPTLHSFALTQTKKHLPYAGCIALITLIWAILNILP